MKRSIIGVAVVTIIGLVVVGVLNINGQTQVTQPGAPLLSPKGMLSISSEPVYRDGQLAIVNPETSKTKEELLRLGLLKDGKLVPVMLEGDMLVPDPESEGEKIDTGPLSLNVITKIAPLGVTGKENVTPQSRGSVLGVIDANGKVLLLGAKQGKEVVHLKIQTNKKLKALRGSEGDILGRCGKLVEMGRIIDHKFVPLELNKKGELVGR